MEVYILEIVLIFIYLIIGAIFAIVEYDDQHDDTYDDRNIDKDDDKDVSSEANYSETNYYDQKQQSSVNTLNLIEIMFFWPVMIIIEVVKMLYTALKND